MAKTWDRQPNEKSFWYERFLRYLHSPRPRSFLAIYNEERVRRGEKKATSPPRSWDVAFDRDHWQERCDAFDAVESERLKKEYAERIELQRQRELKASDLLFAKAEALNELPHLKEKMDIDGESIVVVPDVFAFKVAKELFAESKSQARGALEMTEKKQSLELDLSKLSADALSGLLVATFSEEEDAGADSSGDAATENSSPSESSTTKDTTGA